MLANHAMMVHSSSHGDDADSLHYVDELLVHIPKFQYGMDVNPKFTQGIAGYEYTAQITAFDMLRVKLVHGWLVDPQQREVYEAIGNDTYNSLVEKIIHGNESSSQVESLHQQMAALQVKVDNMTPSVDLLDDTNAKNAEHDVDAQRLEELKRKHDEVHDAATRGSLINDFLQTTGHQLTIYGLQVLYEELQNDELTVFFRNNHFATMTKHEGMLYLLVTDLGYANSPAVVWEKLDVIDGDTEYVDCDFKRAGEQAVQLSSGPTLTPDQLLAQSGQSDADYQLALHLSKQTSTNQAEDSGALDAQEGHLMAAATEASLRTYNGLPDGIKPVDTTNDQKKQASSADNADQKPAAMGSAAQTPKKELVAVGVPLEHPTYPPSGTVAQLPPPNPASGGRSNSATGPISAGPAGGLSHEEADKLLAMQLQAENDSHDEASLHLARQLQAQEDQRSAAASRHRQHRQQQRPQQAAATAGGDSRASNCVIS